MSASSSVVPSEPNESNPPITNSTSTTTTASTTTTTTTTTTTATTTTSSSNSDSTVTTSECSSDCSVISSFGSSTSSKSKSISSYYFFKSTPKEEAEKYKPQPIDPSKLNNESTSSAVGSSWNAAGTWEEKDISKWACDRVKELLEADGGLKLSESKEGATGRITNVKSVKGDASIVFSRGKKKIGYDLSINAEYTGELNGVTAFGTIDLPCVDEQTDEDEWEVRIYSSTEKEKESSVSEPVNAAMRKGADKIRKTIAIMVKELKEMK